MRRTRQLSDGDRLDNARGFSRERKDKPSTRQNSETHFSPPGSRAGGPPYRLGPSHSARPLAEEMADLLEELKSRPSRVCVHTTTNNGSERTKIRRLSHEREDKITHFAAYPRPGWLSPAREDKIEKPSRLQSDWRTPSRPSRSGADGTAYLPPITEHDKPPRRAPLIARFPGLCACRKPVSKGDMIIHQPGKGVIACPRCCPSKLKAAVKVDCEDPTCYGEPQRPCYGSRTNLSGPGRKHLLR